MRDYVVIDTETTGLDRRTREPWDIAMVKLDPETLEEVDRFQFFAFVDMDTANPESLKIGHFYDRSPQASDDTFHEGIEPWIKLIEFTRDTFLVGIQPSFDEHTLWQALTFRGLEPEWFYKLVDAYDVLSGALGIPSGLLKTDDLCERAGVPVPSEDVRHTALGDVLMTADMLRVAKAQMEAHT